MELTHPVYNAFGVTEEVMYITVFKPISSSENMKLIIVPFCSSHVIMKLKKMKLLVRYHVLL